MFNKIFVLIFYINQLFGFECSSGFHVVCQYSTCPFSFSSMLLHCISKLTVCSSHHGAVESKIHPFLIIAAGAIIKTC